MTNDKEKALDKVIIGNPLNVLKMVVDRYPGVKLKMSDLKNIRQKYMGDFRIAAVKDQLRSVMEATLKCESDNSGGSGAGSSLQP